MVPSPAAAAVVSREVESMAEKTTIGWTDATFNPWVGCQKWSPGCLSCYAAVDTRPRVLRAKGLEVWGPPSTTPRERTTSTWGIPMRLHKKALAAGTRTRLFVASLCDIFEDHPQVAPWRAEALALLERCTALDVQLLTKRPENIMSMVPAHWRTAWPSHVWVGATVEDQKRAEQRIPRLLRVPARVRFLSCEPLLEAVNLEAVFSVYDKHGEPSGPRCNLDGTPSVSWVIVGGESGHNARPFDLAWARSIVRQCADAGVACFVKQMGDAPVDSARVDIVNEAGGVAYVRP
jgi:protein gp37